VDRRRFLPVAAVAFVAVIVVVGFGRLGSSNSAGVRTASEPVAGEAPTGASDPRPALGDAEPRSSRTREGAVAAATAYALALDNPATFDPDHRAAVLNDIASDASRDELTAAFDEGLGLISSQLNLDADTVEDPGFVWRTVPGGWQLTEFDRAAATVAVWTAGVAIADGRLLAEPGWRTTVVTLAWEREAWRLVGFETRAGPDPGRASTDVGSVARQINAFAPYRHWPETGSRGAGR
jgi:hypothetical protein